MGLKANEWQSLGGTITGGTRLSAVARGERVDCLVQGGGGSLWVRSWDGAAWRAWEGLGGVMTADPGAAAGADDRIDAFVRGTDNGLWHRALRGEGWAAWAKLDGQLGGSPAAIARSGGRVDVLTRGADGRLWARAFDGERWGEWVDLLGGLASDPALTSSAGDRIDAFVKGTDGALWQRSWDGEWRAWTSLAGQIAEAPAVVSRGRGAIDAFARGGADHRLGWRSFDGERWGEWVDLLGGLASPPSAVALGPDRLVVFVRGTDGALWFRAWDGATWAEWTSLGGVITSTPAAVVTASGEIVVFAAGSDAALWTIRLREASEAPKVEPAPAAAPTARVRGALDVSALLGAAVERLNRGSLLALLHQIAEEVDEHCRAFPARIDDGLLALRRELSIQIEGLRGRVDRHAASITEVNAALAALRAEHGDLFARLEVHLGPIVRDQLTVRLPEVIAQITASLSATIEAKVDASIARVDVAALLARLEAMRAKLELLQRAADELDAGELAQVEVLLRRLLVDLDLSTVVLDMKVRVGGGSLRFGELVEVLAGGDKAAEIHFHYDRGELSGARFVLVDRSEVLFVCARHEGPDGLEYRFEAASWRGVPASFLLRFRRQSSQVTLCKRTLRVDTYDAVTQTNVVFDLTGPRGRYARGFIPECETPPTIAPQTIEGEALERSIDPRGYIPECETPPTIEAVEASGPPLERLEPEG